MNDIFFSRRHFLSRGVPLLSVAATVPAFLDRSAFALAGDNPNNAKKADHVLVVVQLAGGNDGLNTIIPVTNDEYYKARPTIGIAKENALRLNDEFSTHPSAVGLKKVFDAGYLSILHAVAYPNPNRSHFRATDIWTTAEPEKVAKSGWIGRYCDACCSGEDPGPGHKRVPPDPATAIALDLEPPTAMIGPSYVPLSFRSPQNLGFHEAKTDQAKAAFEKLNTPNSSGGMMDAIDDDDHRPPAIPMGVNGSLTQDADAAAFLQRSALNARLYADRIRKSTAAVANKATYPATEFAQDLKLVAQMIASDLPTRVFYVKLGGFDTHSGQIARHDKLMAEMGDGLAAFVDDLKALGQLDRTTLMTFSEFGRRVHENGSGTDHGEAAPLFVIGARIKPGFLGTFPSLDPAKLHRGDVPYTTDFRSLYATILHDWLAVDETKVLGQQFKKLDLFKA